MTVGKLDAEHALPCIVCNKALGQAVPEYVWKPGQNQPYDATAFETRGHYGSTIFDPMNGDALELNVCDECLKRLAGEGKIIVHRGASERTHELWKGD